MNDCNLEAAIWTIAGPTGPTGSAESMGPAGPTGPRKLPQSIVFDGGYAGTNFAVEPNFDCGTIT